MDELCISKRDDLWLWTAVSRYTGQILAFVVGSRGWDHLEHLWSKVPLPWRDRLVYTDGDEVSASFFGGWQHRVCAKGAGGTCTVEGVNTSLRHRCAGLVRRSLSRCRDVSFLEARVFFAVAAHNGAWLRRWNRRLRIASQTSQKRSKYTRGKQ